MFKSDELSRSKIKSIVGAGMNEYGGQYAVLPLFKGGYSNTLVNSGSGDYDGGDRQIGFPNSYEIDGDLLFTAGWGDGFACRRLNNDGTLTKIFHDNNFIWRDTGSTYNHMQSVAIDKINKKGVQMTYNVDGYTTFDYSGCLNGGTTFVKDPRPTHANPQRFINEGGMNISSAGLYYTSGLVCAGEWFYVGEYDARHYQKYPRRNLKTGVEQILTWETNGKSGTANDDRNGYRFTLFYDEVNDRVFYCSYYNANFMMIEKASTASPELVWCDLGDAGVGDDGYEMGLFVEDPNGAPNVMWIGGSSRIVKIDVTPCMTGTKPTILKQVYVNNADNVQFDNLFRFGNKYQKTSGTPMDKDPEYPEYIRTHSDRGWNMLGGWIDKTNAKSPGFRRYNDMTEDTTTGGRGRSYRSDYGHGMVLMSSANGSQYWIQGGYGADGHRFLIWPKEDKPQQLIGDWNVSFGSYTLPNNGNIDMVFLGGLQNYYVPEGCSLTVFVSPDNGVTWETYDRSTDQAHIFTANGTQLVVKIQAIGHPDKSPYNLGYKGKGSVMYGSLHDASLDSKIKFKIPRKRLKGKKK